jgi:hypothetical protein
MGRRQRKEQQKWRVVIWQSERSLRRTMTHSLRHQTVKSGSIARASIVASALGTTLCLARPAAAQPEPSRAECAQAFEESQRLRNTARYLDANREVLKCTNPSCGQALSEECGKIHSELQAATPSVVFAARDEAGNELTDVSVTIDDDQRVLPLDGKPIALDPGNHSFRFQSALFKEHVQAAVIRTGERFRPITVVLEPRASSRNASSSKPSAAHDPEQPAPAKAATSGPPMAVYVLGAVGAVGLGGFVGLRLWGSHDFDDLSQTCKPDCSDSSVDAVRQKYLLSTVSLAVGAAATVAAVTVYLAAPKAPRASAASLQISPSRDGMAARLTARF